MRCIDADVLDEVKFHPLPYTHITPPDVEAETYKRGWNDAIDAIMCEAPTIEPQRKKGEWLDGHRVGYSETLHWYIYCSECLYERDDDDHDKDTPFCPNCGCAMTEEGEQE